MPDEPALDPEKSFSHRLALALLVPLLIVFVGLFVTLFVTHTTAYIDGTIDGAHPARSRARPCLARLRPARQGRCRDVSTSLLWAEIRVLSSSGSSRLPGDEIEVDKGNAFVNGTPEQGDHTVIIGEVDISVPRQIVPDGHVYVLGDNRPISEDSRLFGTVPLRLDTGQGHRRVSTCDRHASR